MVLTRAVDRARVMKPLLPKVSAMADTQHQAREAAQAIRRRRGRGGEELA